MPGDNIIDGRAIAEQIHLETADRIQALKRRGIEPGLVFVRVGDDPASKVYVGMKEKVSRKLGMATRTHALPESTTQRELLTLIEQLNADAKVHGILVQSPVPRQIDPAQVYLAVSPAKDVDGFHPLNMGKLLLGDRSGFIPCTPAGIHELLTRSGIKIAGAEVVILGRGNIVGKPMAALLVQKCPDANATVTICHSQTRDIAGHCRSADIIIAAMGSAEFVKADMIKPGATVIDVGVNRIADASSKTGTRLAGDVDFENARKVAGRITPNPGGVGPMTVAILMKNTVRAAELLNQ
jgi:methylenetetrahydrofolate dehydrogenase (NADP+)/methenyltetrahydrofolate cyclohydrolase